MLLCLTVYMTIQVKKAAVDIVQGLTGSEDGLQSLGIHYDVVLPSLSCLLGEKKVPFAISFSTCCIKYSFYLNALISYDEML